MGKIKCFKDRPLPPSIMPVIILQGTNYEMGRQYGEQAAELIAARKNLCWARGFELFKTRDAVLAEIRVYEYLIKQHTPKLIDIMHGMVEGVKSAGYDLSYLDILIINIRWALVLRPGAVYPPLEGCGHLAAWGSTTKNKKLICSDNQDGEFGIQVVLVYLPQDGNALVTCADAGVIACHPVMNNSGLFLGSSSGPCREKDIANYGIPRPFSFLHMGLTCDTAIEAKDWLQSHNTVFTEGISVSMSDVSGSAFVAENTPTMTVIRKPGDFGESEFIFATNNFLTEKARIAGDKYDSISTPRNDLIYSYLHNYQGQVDLAFIKMMYRTRGYPGMGNLSNNRVVIGLPDNGDNGLACICTGSPCFGAPEMIEVWGLNLPIHPTHSFYEIALSSEPGKITGAAKKTAESDLYKTVVQLEKLNFGDIRYPPLAKIFAGAKKEWFRGIWAEADAAVSNAEDAIYFTSKAVTAFTKCQAKARQVFNALIPPATNPLHLGLKQL